MNPFDEPRDPREEALARALHAQAETVRPVGDGLIRIRSRVERRRSRTRWMVPTASAAAVAATVTAVVASGVLTGSKRPLQPTAFGAVTLTSASTPSAAPSVTRTTTPSPSPSPVAATTAVTKIAPSAAPSVTDHDTTSTPATTSPVVTSDTAPVGPAPVWPFANAAAATTWQQKSAAAGDWHLSSVGTAEHFVDGLKLAGVHLAGATVVTGASTTTVTLQRTSDSGKPVTLAVVELSHWASGANAPWGVVSVSNPFLTVNSPTAGASVSGSVDVTYSAPGTTEGQVSASVYSAGDAGALAQATPATPGTVTVAAKATAAGPGFVVLTNTSSGGSTPTVSSLAVVPVQLQPSTPPTSTYVALVTGKIEVLDASTGTLIRTLAAGTAGIQQVTVTDDGTWVYYATPQGVLRTAVDGSGAPASVTAKPATEVAVAGKDGAQLAWSYVSPTGAGQDITWQTAAGKTGTIHVSDSLPPEAETLAISADGTQIASYVRQGSGGAVNLFQLATPTSGLSDATMVPACAGAVSCAGATYAPSGDLVFATTDGTNLTVFSSHLDVTKELFTVAGSAQTVTLDVDATGTKVLLLERAGQGWMWDGAKASKLPTTVTDASW